MRLGAAGLVAAAAAAWAGLLVATPLLARSGSESAAVAAALSYRTTSIICHQQRARSFALGGAQLPVCARCLGLYAGGAVGALFSVGWLWRRRRVAARGPGPPLARLRLAMVVLALPTIGSWAIEFGLGIFVPNLARGVTAVPLGAAIGALVTAWAGGASFDDNAAATAIH
jgi:hypothetical protein